MICICPADASHCHSIISCYVHIISCASKIKNGLPFWCQRIQVVLEKRLLNGYSSSSTNSKNGLLCDGIINCVL